MSTENEIRRHSIARGQFDMPTTREEADGDYVLYSDHLAVVEGLRRLVEETAIQRAGYFGKCCALEEENRDLRSSIDARVEMAKASAIDEKIVKKRSFALYKKHITGRGYAWPVGCTMPDDAQAAVSEGMREGFALGVAAVLEQLKGEKE